MEPTGYVQLIRSLVAPDTSGGGDDSSLTTPDPSLRSSTPVLARAASSPPAPTEDPERDGSIGQKGHPAMTAVTLEDELASGPASAVSQGHASGQEEANAIPRRAPTIDLTPTRLLITSKEQTFIELLAPLIATPRVAKRLVNTYRLLRVSATEPTAFEGQDGPGEYQAVLLLLAIMNGFPSQASTFFRELSHARHETWPKFVSDLQPMPLEINIPGATDEPIVDPRTSTGTAAEFSSRLLGRMRLAEAAPWLRLCKCLNDIMPHVEMTTLTVFQAWVPLVARYSFDMGRMTTDP